MTLLKSAIINNLEKFGEIYLFVYGLSKRVYYLIANAYIKSLISYRIERGLGRKLIRDIFRERSSNELEKVFVVSNDDVLKLLNVRLIRNNLGFLRRDEYNRVNKLYREGFNLYLWRISLRRGRALGIHNILFLNIKTRTRTLLNDILRAFFNDDFYSFWRKAIFVVIVEDLNLTISTVESILSFFSSKSADLIPRYKNTRIMIPKIFIGFSNVIIPVKDEEYLNRLGGIIKNFTNRVDAAKYYSGMRFNLDNYPPVISDNIIDLDRDAMGVTIAFHDVFSSKSTPSFHSFLCVKDEPYVLWKILSKFYSIWSCPKKKVSKKKKYVRKAYLTKKRRGKGAKKEILRKQVINRVISSIRKIIRGSGIGSKHIREIPIIINLSDIRIKVCNYRPTMELSKSRGGKTTKTFLITMTLDMLIPKDLDACSYDKSSLISRLSNEGDSCVAMYGIKTITKDIVSSKNLKDCERYSSIERYLKKQLEQLVHKDDYVCPKEISCPLSTLIYNKKKMIKEKIDSNGLENVDKISFNTHFCVTGWDSPATVFQVITLLIFIGLTSNNNLLKELCDEIYKHIRENVEYGVNLRYITTFSCINPVRSLLEMIFIVEDIKSDVNSIRIEYPVIRNALFIPISELDIVSYREYVLEYLRRLANFLNEVHKDALCKSSSSIRLGGEFYRLSKVQGAYVISNKFLGRCDIKYCPIGKRKIALVETLETQLLKMKSNSESCSLKKELIKVRRRIHEYFPPDTLLSSITILKDLADLLFCLEMRRNINRINRLIETRDELEEKIAELMKLMRLKRKVSEKKERGLKEDCWRGIRYKRKIEHKKLISIKNSLDIKVSSTFKKFFSSKIKLLKRFRKNKESIFTSNGLRKEKKIKVRDSNEIIEKLKNLDELMNIILGKGEIEIRQRSIISIDDYLEDFYTRFINGIRSYLREKEDEIKEFGSKTKLLLKNQNKKCSKEGMVLAEIFERITPENAKKIAENEAKLHFILEYLHYSLIEPRWFSARLAERFFEIKRGAPVSSVNLVSEVGW